MCLYSATKEEGLTAAVAKSRAAYAEFREIAVAILLLGLCRGSDSVHSPEKVPSAVPWLRPSSNERVELDRAQKIVTWAKPRRLQ